MKIIKYKYLSQQLPQALLASLQTVKGFDEKSFVHVHASAGQIVSIRINPSKGTIDSLTHSPIVAVPWSSTGYYLAERPSFTLDPLFHAGAYYVQEASSMFLEEALKQTSDLSKSLKVLDLCAAPGGKSTLIQSFLSPESLLVSNEVIKTRANILAENITKWGVANVVVTNNDPKDFQRLPEFFDVIVVDAPCSGSGLFRKDPDAINQWSLNNVELCSQRQQRILADIFPCLKPGGTLIYCTCSYSESEDEAICDWLKDVGDQVSGIRLKIKDEWNIVETQSRVHHQYGYRFYPDKLKGEGFFLAAFRKNGNSISDVSIKVKTKPALVTKAEEAILKPFLKDAHQFSFLKFKDEVIAFPQLQFENLLALQSNLYLKKAGIKMGTIIRNELIPDHELVLSSVLSSVIRKVSVNKETALNYLRRKDIAIDADVKGWAVIEYNGLPLGLAKILPNRINNYYPKEWRIINK